MTASYDPHADWAADNTPEEPSLRALEDRYCDVLDEIYPVVSIGGLLFDPSRVLEQCDPIAFREGFLGWLDSEGIDQDGVA